MLHRHHTTELGPQTHGRTIRWATVYDPLVTLLTLGHASALRRQTVALADVKAGERVLDVGCGTGDVSLIARATVGPTGAVSGIDAAPEMIAVAQRKAAQHGANVDFRVGLIERLDFPANTFDVVLSSLMMHHLPTELQRQGLAEIQRVLKPAGRLLIVDLKRPTSRLSRLSVTFMMHGALRQGVQDLSPGLQAAGFARIETGNTLFGAIGFVRAVARK